jgi:tetraacyldisaccharide 4'-kinase
MVKARGPRSVLKISADYFRDLVQGRKRGIGPTLLRCGLAVVSQGYGLAVAGRNWMYDRHWLRSESVPVPVISIGNLTLGGTGKTPCVEYVCRLYRSRDLRVAILSRGYGQTEGPNDEALLLEESLPDVPHLQGTDRAALAATAVEELESEILVLDDGFQHRRLQRTLDVVLLDMTDPWGAGRLFPRGLLREPARSLKRAQAVVLTRCDQSNEQARQRVRTAVERRAPGAIVAETSHRPVELQHCRQPAAPVDLLAGKAVAAFCGIGNPASFRTTLEHAGADIIAFRTYPDHHAYNASDVADLRNWASKQAKDCLVVTTQKDLVKLRLPDLGGKALWALRVGLHFETGQEALDQKLLEAAAIS